jgi:hypothetical protein
MNIWDITIDKVLNVKNTERKIDLQGDFNC